MICPVENRNFLVYRQVPSSGNVIVTIAIGTSVLWEWKHYIKNNWLDYCDKWNIGLIVITGHLLDENSELWKKPTWQKLLIPQFLSDEFPSATRVCYLDTDILISPISPDIFCQVPLEKIGLVSLYNSLPYNRKETLDRISFFRHINSNSFYPLDSSLYISIEAVYEFHNLEPKSEYACMGMFVFTISENLTTLFNAYFEMYGRNVLSITNGGDQTHLNYHFQNDFDIQWLEYKWQAIWVYEAANFYPKAFWGHDDDSFLSDISSSLMNNFFLHFAGNWNESNIWKKCSGLRESAIYKSLMGLQESKSVPRTGIPKGAILPFANNQTRLSLESD